jgi:hypothetical protein
MTATFTESAQPGTHYANWLKIPSERWLSLQEVRDALADTGVSDTTGALDQQVGYLTELGYLLCSSTVEVHRVKPGRWETPGPQHERRVVVPRYRKQPLHEVPFEAELHRVHQELAEAAKKAQADEDARLDAALRRRGLTLPVAETSAGQAAQDNAGRR